MNFPTTTIFKQAAHYATAVASHVATGSRTRTDSEVAALLTLCRACPHYDPSGRCTLCGCRLSTSANAYTNKLRMASQHCPAGKW